MLAEWGVSRLYSLVTIVSNMYTFSNFSLGNWQFVTSVVIAVLLAVPVVSYGQTILRTDDSVTVDAEQVVEGNFYSVGSRVSISGEVIGDWVAAGGSVTGNGIFQDDVLLLAGNVQLHGSTTDDVRIVAGDTVIADYVGGDLAVLGGSVEILSSAVIAGDVLIYANDAVIAGTVGGDIIGRYGSLRIDAPIAGSVDARVNELTLGNRASIEGDLRYESAQEIVRAQDAVVDGDITHREVVTDISVREQMQNAVMPILILIFAALVFFLVQRRRFDAVVEHTIERPLLFSLVGVGITLATPLLIALLFVSVLGSLVGLVVASLYVLILTLGAIFTVPILGLALGRYVLQRPQIDLLSLGLGALVLYALMIVPVIGIPIVLVVMFVTIGGIATWLYQR